MATARRLPGRTLEDLRKLGLAINDYKRCGWCHRWFRKGLGAASHERAERKKRNVFIPKRKR